MRRGAAGLMGLALLGSMAAGAYAGTRPVPAQCNALVNQQLVDFVHANAGNSQAHMDNVLVCGQMTRPSFSQHSSARTHHGGHQVLSLAIPTGDGQTAMVEIVTNDDLDGVVKAQTGDAVYAYGQVYIPNANEHRPGGLKFAAGVHDTHCATHMGADDGWVVVAGMRFPQQACSISSAR